MIHEAWLVLRLSSLSRGERAPVLQIAQRLTRYLSPLESNDRLKSVRGLGVEESAIRGCRNGVDDE